MGKQRDDYDGQLLTRQDQKVQTPPMYRVLLHNDDYTTMDFVIEVLKKFFRKAEPEAVHIMLTVHHRGVGIAGVYPREIAETKAEQVNIYSRQRQHPLKCSVERI